MSAVEDPPATGTRPRNRRELIVRAAGDLFYREGYAHVSITDIARAVNVGHSALYRHFDTKSELLSAAIRNGVRPFQDLLEAEESSTSSATARLDHILQEMATAALDNRETGVLWQREARNLDDVDQKPLREELRHMVNRLSTLLRAARSELDAAASDLLAWCVVSALVSVGFHSLRLPRPQYRDLLVSIARTIAALDWVESDSTVVPVVESTIPATGSRRDQLLSIATALFAERGYGAVSIDEIGEAAGIAGPSIYSFFAGKHEILTASIHRANDLFQADVTTILSRDTDAASKLRALVDSFVRLAATNRFAVGIALSELDQLGPDEQDYARDQQRRYIDTWARLLVDSRGFDETAARIRVQAVLLVVNDAVQTPHLRAAPEFEPMMRQLAITVLGLDPVALSR